jgi:hypothetical protein
MVNSITLALLGLVGSVRGAEEACLTDGESSSLLQLQAKDAEGPDACPVAEGGVPKLGCAWGPSLWWMRQSVSALFYWPHYQCSSAEGTTNVKAWLESVLQGTTNGEGDDLPKPDFLGFSEMESMAGMPGDVEGFNHYKVLSAVCGSYRDPISLYYNTKSWNLVESFPPSPKCGRFPQWPAPQGAGDPFQCASDQATPREDNCCSCTNSDNLMNEPFYSGAVIKWPNNGTSDTATQLLGDRPFVLGKFENKVSKRKVCAVTFNLPHQLLANCTNSVEAACFSNAAGNAFRIGTAQFVKAINEVCQQTPLILLGDTNDGSGSYPTAFMFHNPSNPDVAENAKPCPQPAPLLHLRDPQSALAIEGSPYTCCKEDGGENLYASDRVAASGPSWASIGGYFNPKTLLGGARKAGQPIGNPLSVGIKASCPGVGSENRGYPCCGAGTEHAPVWGFFDLFR